MEFILVLFGIMIVLGFWAVVAAKFDQIAEDKGYSGYFWWVFLTGVIGILMVVALPDREKVTIKDTAADSQNSNTQTQSGYSLRKTAIQSTSNKTVSGSWTCDKCGKSNPMYTGTCSCGNSRYNNK